MNTGSQRRVPSSSLTAGGYRRLLEPAPNVVPVIGRDLETHGLVWPASETETLGPSITGITETHFGIQAMPPPLFCLGPTPDGPTPDG